jgi:ribonuclease T1
MDSRRIRAALAALAAAALAAGGIAVSSGGDEEPAPAPATSVAGEEAAAITATIAAIDSGEPLPYEEDGGTFQNREGLLPEQPLGYYREYTVETPGSADRGARRLVIGEGGETYYTDDHYASFEEIDPNDFR